MWLINTKSLLLEEKSEGEPVRWKYAILSHTWAGCEEVSFSEYKSIVSDLHQSLGTDIRFPSQADLDRAGIKKSGFHKIYRTCDLARARGIDYAWVDTCCINKSSSSELSEAINSMFRWYQEAEVCFAYLIDLPAGEGTATRSDLAGRRWFFRGWTLQELIAPGSVEFYDYAWNLRGNKGTLESILFEITRIPPKLLRDSSTLPEFSVGQRMAWASDRHTERVEDMAYCLFGIFDVHLPLIYGERTNAFIRLQEAIAQDSNDLSLFAWTSNDAWTYRGAFAQSPSEFSKCDNLRRIDNPIYQTASFSLSNNALHMSAHLLQGQLPEGGERDYLLNLQCVDETIQQVDGTKSIIFIRLVKTAHGFIRHLSNATLTLSRSSIQTPGLLHSIDVPKHINSSQSRAIALQNKPRISLVINNSTAAKIEARSYTPPHLWDKINSCFITNAHDDFVGIFEICLSNGPISNSQNNMPLRYNHGWPEVLLITGLKCNSGQKQVWSFIVQRNDDPISEMLMKFEKDHDPYWLSEIRTMALDRIRERSRQELTTANNLGPTGLREEIQVGGYHGRVHFFVSTILDQVNPGNVVLNWTVTV